MTGGHNKVEYFSGLHIKESSFLSKDLSLALAVAGKTACSSQNCVLGVFT